MNQLLCVDCRTLEDIRHDP